MSDPTRDELVAHLTPMLDELEAEEFDQEDAIYWFAADNHMGQGSNLYSVLSTSPFSPGRLQSGPGSPAAVELYQALSKEFG